MPTGGDHRPTIFPYVSNAESSDVKMPSGGIIIRGIALVDLKIGESVFANGTLDTFTKSATPANYATLNGVVVGGTQTFGQVLQDDALIGSTVAAKAGETVMIMTFGVAKVIADAAMATVHVKVTGASTTSGRTGTTSAAAGNYLGILLDAAAGAASIVRIYVGAAH